MPYQDKDPHRTGIGAKVPLGKVVHSDGIQALIASDPVAAMTLNTFLRFHENGNWGTSAPDLVRANEEALASGGEIVSRYQLQGRAILIVTDAEPRDKTTVMLNDER